MSVAGAPAPLTDAALRDRIGIPDEVRGHLRRYEHAVRERLAELAGTDDAQAAASREELRMVLADARRSPLLRALRRRAVDLVPGASARRSLDNALGAVLSRAERALRRVQAAAEYRRTLDGLHARYAGPLPWHLARALERAGIAPGTLDRLSDAGSILARTERMRAMDAELEDQVAALPRMVEEPLEISLWPDGVSPAELAAAVHEAERAESSGTGPAWRARGRAQAAEHAQGLLGGGTGTGVATTPAEAAALEALQLVAAGHGTDADDLDAQGLVLRGAVRRRAPAPAPAHAAAGDPGRWGDAAGSLLFVVPLFGPYVLVRRGSTWPVRVDDRSVRVGKPARCVAALPPESPGTPLPPEAWAAPLFDLPDGADGQWLATRTPASVTPFARIGPDRWLAEVRKRGTLQPAEGPRGSASRPRVGAAVRILSPSAETRAEEAIAVGPALHREAGPFGWTTLRVPLALADVPEGWLRTADTPAGRDHVEAEQRFFQAAGRLVPGRTPRCLGRSADPSGFVYAPPLALTPESSLALRSWREKDPTAFAAAAARLWTRLTEAGLALGFYHASTLAFRVQLAGGGSPGTLEAVAVAAPLGTRLGAAYRRSRESVDLFPHFERLGGIRLPPAQANGDVAMPQTEAAAAALYQLDLLATRPIHLPAGAPWDEILDMLAAQPPSAFTSDRLAAELIRAMRPPVRAPSPPPEAETPPPAPAEEPTPRKRFHIE